MPHRSRVRLYFPDELPYEEHGDVLPEGYWPTDPPAQRYDYLTAEPPRRPAPTHSGEQYLRETVPGGCTVYWLIKRAFQPSAAADD
jgi:hypothetical protein